MSKIIFSDAAAGSPRTTWIVAYIDAEDARFQAHWMARTLGGRFRVYRETNTHVGTVWAIDFA